MQPGVGSFVRRTKSVTDKALDGQLDAALLRWLVTCGVAYNTVDDPHFVQFTSLLNPAYTVAGAHPVLADFSALMH